MTEVKKQKISGENQALAPSAEAKDLLGKIKYIQEKNENINRYSDKLSKALYTISQIIAKINISRDFAFLDTEPFCTTEINEFETEKGFLLLKNGNLETEFQTTNVIYDMPHVERWQFGSIPRKERKAIIQSGRLPKFLAHVAEQLEKADLEYNVVSEIAEKMAKAIQE